MGYGFKHGGGGSAAASLNFKVVGGTSSPSAPAENTIWVNTATEISSWMLSPVQPEAVEGLAWITMGSASAAAFNALKKNGIMIYPIAAKQYVDGAWANKAAEIYQNGAWKSFSTEALYLYTSGDTCDEVTGGYTAAGMRTGSSTSSSSTGAPAISYNESSMVISAATSTSSSTYNGGIIRTKSKVDCSQYEKLIFEGTVEGLGIIYTNATISIWSEMGAYHSENRVLSTDLANGSATVEVDISNLTESYYIGFSFGSANQQITVTMTSLRLE